MRVRERRAQEPQAKLVAKLSESRATAELSKSFVSKTTLKLKLVTKNNTAWYLLVRQARVSVAV